MAIAYRYYSAFIAARVVALDDTRETPAHTLKDGHNYLPMNKWVLFGHHFAAISGAGPSSDRSLQPSSAISPGSSGWSSVSCWPGPCMTSRCLWPPSAARGGRFAEIARNEISPLAGLIGSIAILIIVVIALAGLGLAVANALRESSWGTFTIAMTIPVALFVGLWMYRIRPGRIVEASVIGVIGVIACVILGGLIPGSFLAPYFTLSREGITIAMGVYGFLASVLPVWLLLAPRDYLSSYMKIGTIGALIVGVIVVNPVLQMPAVTVFTSGGGPIIPGNFFRSFS